MPTRLHALLTRLNEDAQKGMMLYTIRADKPDKFHIVCCALCVTLKEFLTQLRCAPFSEKDDPLYVEFMRTTLIELAPRSKDDAIKYYSKHNIASLQTETARLLGLLLLTQDECMRSYALETCRAIGVGFEHGMESRPKPPPVLRVV